MNSLNDRTKVYVCIRNFGDCLLQAFFIASIIKDSLNDVTVITLKKNKFIFDEMGIKSILIPNISSNYFEWLTFIKFALKLKSNIFFFFGDIRERLLSLIFIRSQVFIPIWPESNYLNKVLRLSGPLFNCTKIYLMNFNIYLDFRNLVEYSNSLYLKSKLDSNTSDHSTNDYYPFKFKLTNSISLQVLGSIPDKNIPDSIVKLMLDKFLDKGIGVNFIGDELQIDKIKNTIGRNSKILYFNNFDDGKRAILSSIGFIGVDSFWAHFAILNSIPAFIFTGGFPSSAIYPSNSNTFSIDSRCSAFPCNAKPICFNSEDIPLSCFGSHDIQITLSRIDKFISEL